MEENNPNTMIEVPNHECNLLCLDCVRAAYIFDNKFHPYNNNNNVIWDVSGFQHLHFQNWIRTRQLQWDITYIWTQILQKSKFHPFYYSQDQHKNKTVCDRGINFKKQHKDIKRLQKKLLPLAGQPESTRECLREGWTVRHTAIWKYFMTLQNFK